MRFAMDEDQIALAGAVREVLQDKCPSEVIREAWTDVAEPTMPAQVATMWESLQDLELPGLLVPESRGGLGLDEIYLVGLMEEVGYAAVPLPVLETVCAAPLLATQSSTATEEANGLTAWCPQGEGLVAWGHWADHTILGGQPPVSRLRITGRLPVDGTVTVDRARGGVTFDTTRAIPDNEITSDPVTAHQFWLRGVLGCSAMSVGLGRRLMDLTKAYVTERHQFGAPIGSFQAIKHHLATAHLAVEFARPAVHRAAWSLATTGSGQLDTVTSQVAMAKLLADRAGAAMARTAIQCHGGMGYTTESDVHLFAKRVWALQASFGTSQFHRKVVGGEIERSRQEQAQAFAQEGSA